MRECVLSDDIPYHSVCIEYVVLIDEKYPCRIVLLEFVEVEFMSVGTNLSADAFVPRSRRVNLKQANDVAYATSCN